MPLLSVKDLTVTIKSERGKVYAVNAISFDLDQGEVVAIVGESGCGKSVTALALTNLLPKPAARIEKGSIRFDGTDIATLSDAAMQELRGGDISIIFQDPMTSLNPVLTIGEQLSEAVTRTDERADRAVVRRKAAELLDMVGIAGGEAMLRAYPHQISGGMRQRVMIAMALALKPRLLIADEPTTGLDVTVEAQILDLMMGLVSDMKTSMLLITHDLGVVAGTAQRVVVMYSGMIVEMVTTDDLFAAPSHPYTIGLLRASPRIDGEQENALVPIDGVPPNQLLPLQGCPFAPRCRWRRPICWREVPTSGAWTSAAGTMHVAACHNRPTPAEAAAGMPLDPSFTAAPPPDGLSSPDIVLFERREVA
ncbi:ABC transporter ATP-binding protein [Rhizobium lusitanum]|nr:ABC transporter ATP-binding protein [Rhizobium lusitanum]